MSSLLYTFQEAFHAPFTSIWVVIITFSFVFTLFERINHLNYAINYQEIMVSKQYYRLLTAALLCPSPTHYIFMLTSLWSIRSLEWALGTIFFAKYTIILVLSESILVILVLNFINTRTRSLDSTIDVVSSNIHAALYNVNIFGSTGTLFGWLAYASIPSTMEYYTDYFYFLGIIPVPWSITPLVLFLMVQFFVPKINAVNNFTGFLCGYFLLIGILQVLPTPYWSFCILLDIFVYITLKSTAEMFEISVEERSVRSASGELNDLLVFPEYIEPEIPEVSTAVSDENGRLDEDEEEIKVNEESLPLLML